MRQLCSDALGRADFPLATTTVDTTAEKVHLTSAGTDKPSIVVLPGTGHNAAAALPWLRALSQHWPTTIVDLPGQPGLSDPRRPPRARLAWYGRVLDEVLDVTQMDGVVLAGNTLGAAVALAAGSPRVAARLLVSPAGFVRLTVDPKLVGVSAAWLLRPTADRTRDVLQLFVAPRPQRTRDGGGVDDPDGRELPHDPGPAAAARRAAGRPRHIYRAWSPSANTTGSCQHRARRQ
ncbi:alpha/beta fold hydrolase [Catellatospora sichuanensis]|uniref:alpha/beta fold hydrolase n=1 Tax=Catellatospora sichuanensis TaxID=1969805 RepID=UPI0016429A93|nr:alpha/beta fold hydrolase [Catellatospora sichuanensis]